MNQPKDGLKIETLNIQQIKNNMKRQFKIGDRVMVTVGSINTHYGIVSFVDPQDKEQPYQVEFIHNQTGVNSSGWFNTDKVHSINDKHREKWIKALIICALFIALVLLGSKIYQFAYEKGQQNGLNQGYKLRQVEEAFEKMNRTQIQDVYTNP